MELTLHNAAGLLRTSLIPHAPLWRGVYASKGRAYFTIYATVFSLVRLFFSWKEQVSLKNLQYIVINQSETSNNNKLTNDNLQEHEQNDQNDATGVEKDVQKPKIEKLVVF